MNVNDQKQHMFSLFTTCVRIFKKTKCDIAVTK